MKINWYQLGQLDATTRGLSWAAWFLSGKIRATIWAGTNMNCSDLDIRKLARACGVPVGRRSGGRLAMTLVATINILIFHFIPPFFRSPSLPFLIERVLGSKNLFSKSWGSAQKPKGRHLSRPRQPFWGHFWFCRLCRRWASAPGTSKLAFFFNNRQTWIYSPL